MVTSLADVDFYFAIWLPVGIIVGIFLALLILFVSIYLKLKPKNRTQNVEREMEMKQPGQFFQEPNAQSQPKSDSEYEKASYQYLKAVFVVFLFYIVPTFQLLRLDQFLHQHPDIDIICHYNVKCSNELYLLGYEWLDFNHIYSNIGYILLGVLAAATVAFVNIRDKKERENKPGARTGIPPHFGLFYALSAVIAGVGILSAGYHTCPNGRNFHHDTCFMYIAIVLTVVKLHQGRHPDTNASALYTFGWIGIAILLTIPGETNDFLPFWIIFSVIHFICVLLLTLILIFDDCNLFRIFRKPILKFSRWPIISTNIKWLVAILLLVNFCILPLPFCLEELPNDFDTYLLALLGINMAIYLLYYIVMKLTFERKSIPWICPVLFVIAVVLWFFAVQFFKPLDYDKPQDSYEDCILFNYYDSHDMWHFLSAGALFFTILFLLTIDDGLRGVPRDMIRAF